MRSPVELVQRGFDNSFVNWPLILINVASQIAAMVVVFAGVIAAILPLVAMGSLAALRGTADDPEKLFETLLAGSPLLVLYIVAVITALIIPVIMIYAFVEGGRLGVYLEGEGAADARPSIDRQRFNVFDPQRWMGYAKKSWWTIFWVYNVAWGIALLVMIAPLLLAIGPIWVLRESEAALGLGCAALAATVLLMFVVSVITLVWSKIANTIVVRDGARTIEALSRAARSMRLDAGAVSVLTLILIGISIVFGISMFTIYFGVAFANSIPGLGIVLIPLQIAMSLGQSVLSAFISCWYSASYVSFVHAQRPAALENQTQSSS